jgi:hypothetical protein
VGRRNWGVEALGKEVEAAGGQDRVTSNTR